MPSPFFDIIRTCVFCTEYLFARLTINSRVSSTVAILRTILRSLACLFVETKLMSAMKSSNKIWAQLRRGMGAVSIVSLVSSWKEA